MKFIPIYNGYKILDDDGTWCRGFIEQDDKDYSLSVEDRDSYTLEELKQVVAFIEELKK